MAPKEKRSFKTSKTNCCVVGCSNTYLNSPDLSFYSFPNQKFPGRKEKWIAAIRRIGSDGKPWQPTKHSKVCSIHFVGGKKSDHSMHPAYVPTLLPKLYKKPVLQQKQQEARFSRNVKRKVINFQPETHDDTVVIDENSTSSFSVNTCAVQTDPCIIDDNNQNMAFLFCSSMGNDVCIQTSVPVPAHKTKDKIIVKETKHVKCGPDVSEKAFHGYESIQDEDEMSGLCGIPRTKFQFLLRHLSQKSSILSTENLLMMFLVKMKLGMTFAALGVLFGVHRTTASKRFFLVLEELVTSCANLVFWPSKFAVQTLMPAAFLNYSNVRAIIDCTELPCERPPRTDQQVLLYSDYKGRYTVKFLVAISPNGFISFISKGYGGRTTDAFLTVNCGFLDLLEEGDCIMSDKGFPLIDSHLNSKCVQLIMPPFANKDQFSKEESDTTYKIASVRIHVERSIARIKTYRILDKITIELLPYVDAIMRMCCVLVNLQQPIIKVNS